MDVYITLLIFAVTLPTYLSNMKNLLQFEDMIKCTIPSSSPLIDFADYGCYCGLGGQGLPVDVLDLCCFRHDSCYDQTKNLESCSLFDSPYTNTYDYNCDKITRTITCLASNDACDMFICKCDKTAAECFAQAPYNTSNNHLSSSVCSAASTDISSFITTLTAFTFTLIISLFTRSSQ
ncbi:phospholipase A2-like isoform X2 [Danio aesculapii]|uniref:phospholipase A2-like isoform X2 n=1 Tax=Danio aesculapii TaxID=1142201 RepID=UPI0024BF56E4|nr:phospholipase A2-like isoform X2 [Danio aesculapii]